MPAFKYEGRNRAGATQKGVIEAADQGAAVALLRRQGVLGASVSPKSRDIQLKIPGFEPKVTEKDLVTFTRQFATMIDAGLPLVQCLEILGGQTENKTFGGIINKVRADVEQGSTFAEALRKHPKAYPELYVNMVAAGEAGGILDTILNRLATYIEKTMALKKKVKSAMVYPSVVVTVAVAVVFLMLLFVIPTFEKMFQDFGGTLPAVTQSVIDLSKFLQKYWWLIIGVIVAAIVGLKRYRASESGKRQTDAMALKLPIVGVLVRKVAVAKFTRTLGTLITSGVPILDGLDIVARTAGNKVIEEGILKTRQAISEGKTIAEPLQQTGVFPPMVVQMIGVGESAGALDTMLGKIADFYDEEVDTAVGALSSMLEPFIMVFLGIALGYIVIAMYLPVFKLAGTIG
ncbi:MAG TPA: type II secretion system F family protein [bacterium]